MIRIVLVLAATVVATSVAAQPQSICKHRAELVDALKQKFGETQQAFGLQNDTHVLEVFASPSGSWTAVVTTLGGKSCIVASGQAWTSSPLVIGTPL